MIINSKRRQKRHNQIRIIKLLQSHQAMSRKHIAELTHLTQASITQLTNGMIEAGILREVGTLETQERKAGPKEVLLDIDETFQYIFGIDIERDTVTLGLVTLKGRPLIKRSFEYDLDQLNVNNLDEFVTQVATSLSEMLQAVHLTSRNVAGCGIGMVGREYYYQTRGLPMPPMLLAKERLLPLLQERLNFPVVLENNVRALAKAEATFFDHQTRSFLYIKVGPGVGSAIVLHDKVYRGENNQAGEIGSSQVTAFYPEVKHDAPIYLEDIFSLTFIKLEIEQKWSSDRLPFLFERVEGRLDRLQIADIYDALAIGEPIVVELYQKKIRLLADLIIDYTNLLDIQHVYLYFGSKSSKELFAMLTTALQACFKRFGRLVTMSHIEHEHAFLGGAGVAYGAMLKTIEQTDQELTQFKR